MSTFTIQHLKDYLQSIFTFYNLKYKLKCKLEFTGFSEGGYFFRGCYVTSNNTIYLDLLRLDDISLKLNLIHRGFNITNKLQFFVSILLHELKHANDKKLLHYEYTLGSDKLAHKDKPSEKRADYFAIQEAKQW